MNAMENKSNIFSNEEITVTYNPSQCIRADKCAKELSEVFRNSVIPWIDLDGCETERIIEQIKRCPSGALKYYHNKKRKAS